MLLRLAPFLYCSIFLNVRTGISQALRNRSCVIITCNHILSDGVAIAVTGKRIAQIWMAIVDLTVYYRDRDALTSSLADAAGRGRTDCAKRV